MEYSIPYHTSLCGAFMHNNNMREKIYERFKVKTINGSKNYKTNDGKASEPKIAVVTDDSDELVIVEMPLHIKHPKSVAKMIAEAMTKSKLALTDLI